MARREKVVGDTALLCRLELWGCEFCRSKCSVHQTDQTSLWFGSVTVSVELDLLGMRSHAETLMLHMLHMLVHMLHMLQYTCYTCYSSPACQLPLGNLRPAPSPSNAPMHLCTSLCPAPPNTPRAPSFLIYHLSSTLTCLNPQARGKSHTKNGVDTHPN
jgi:hypothetical protein